MISGNAGLTEMLAPIIAVFVGAIVVAAIVSIALYIYYALVFQTIAKKLNYSKPWLAWIPIANLFLYPILAKKHWAWGFIFLVPIVGTVFYFIWFWKIFEFRKYPGWLSLIPLLSIIPLLNFLVLPGYLVVLGLVAWKDRK
jgi:hypothetical protein